MNTHPAFAPGSPLHGLARFAPEDWMRLFWHVRLESGVEAVARLCNLARETAAGLLAQSRLHRMVEAAAPRTTSDPHDPAEVDPEGAPVPDPSSAMRSLRERLQPIARRLLEAARRDRRRRAAVEGWIAHTREVERCDPVARLLDQFFTTLNRRRRLRRAERPAPVEARPTPVEAGDRPPATPADPAAEDMIATSLLSVEAPDPSPFTDAAPDYERLAAASRARILRNLCRQLAARHLEHDLAPEDRDLIGLVCEETRNAADHQRREEQHPHEDRRDDADGYEQALEAAAPPPAERRHRGPIPLLQVAPAAHFAAVAAAAHAARAPPAPAGPAPPRNWWDLPVTASGLRVYQAVPPDPWLWPPPKRRP